MKNQYVGDVNDYRKYGLLRAIARLDPGHLCVAWMLTPDDQGRDGQRVQYLGDPAQARFDPELHAGLQRAFAGHETRPRSVALVEHLRLIPGATFFGETVPDADAPRAAWFARLLAAVGGADLVFLDPDNGFEVASKPAGRKDSSKYVLWREIEALWWAGKSLLVYQHFPRFGSRDAFLERVAARIGDVAVGARVTVVRTSHVAFFLVEPSNGRLGDRLAPALAPSWAGQLAVWTPGTPAPRGD